MFVQQILGLCIDRDSVKQFVSGIGIQVVDRLGFIGTFAFAGNEFIADLGSQSLYGADFYVEVQFKSGLQI